PGQRDRGKAWPERPGGDVRGDRGSRDKEPEPDLHFVARQAGDRRRVPVERSGRVDRGGRLGAAHRAVDRADAAERQLALGARRGGGKEDGGCDGGDAQPEPGPAPWAESTHEYVPVWVIGGLLGPTVMSLVSAVSPEKFARISPPSVSALGVNRL